MDSPIQIGDRITWIIPTVLVSYWRRKSSSGPFCSYHLYRKNDRSGSANVFGIISNQAVSGDLYSEAYYWIDNAVEYEAYTPEYNQVVDQTVASIEEDLKGRPEVTNCGVAR